VFNKGNAVNDNVCIPFGGHTPPTQIEGEKLK
jgi:hypothetical protein